MDALSRRQFLASLAALGACGNRVFAAAKAMGVPDHWAASVASAAERVARNAKECPFGFWFVTDPHFPSNALHSGELLAELGAATPVKRVLCGGDIPKAFANPDNDDKAALDRTIALYNEHIVGPVEAAGLPFYPAKGNHDFTIRLASKSPDGFTYDLKAARDILMKGRIAKDIVTNPDDPTACYYYFDDRAAKFRVIVADTTDAVDPKRKYWAVKSSMGKTQLDWLAREALATVPRGYGVAVMHHIPIYAVVEKVEQVKSSVFRPFRQLLEAYQNRGLWMANGTAVDFAKAEGRIMIDLTGHEHCERLTYHNGILHATNPCDATYGNYIGGSRPWCVDLPQKKRMTPFEHTFDAVQFDPVRELVRFTRVGGGADRVVRLRPIEIKVGETAEFKPECVAGVDFFGGFDADNIAFDPNPKSKYDPFPRYFSERAQVSKDGRIRAMKSGEYVVLARNASGEKEIAPVVIV